MQNLLTNSFRARTVVRGASPTNYSGALCLRNLVRNYRLPRNGLALISLATRSLSCYQDSFLCVSIGKSVLPSPTTLSKWHGCQLSATKTASRIASLHINQLLSWWPSQMLIFVQPLDCKTRWRYRVVANTLLGRSPPPCREGAAELLLRHGL